MKERNTFFSLWRGVIPDPGPAPRTMRQIATDVAARHGFTLEALQGQRRFRDIVWARQEAMAEMYAASRVYSTPRIGQFLGGRDHTTVLHGIRAHHARFPVGECKMSPPGQHRGVA